MLAVAPKLPSSSTEGLSNYIRLDFDGVRFFKECISPLGVEPACLEIDEPRAVEPESCGFKPARIFSSVQMVVKNFGPF
jgi:hypothetical protein